MKMSKLDTEIHRPSFCILSIVIFIAANSFTFYVARRILDPDKSSFYSLLEAVVLFWTGVVLVVYTWVTWNLSYESRRQAASMSSYNLTNLSNQQNWDIFDRHKQLPQALPSWVGLSDIPKGWGWRTLHLNHLNLLLLAHEEHGRGLMNDHDLKAWVLKGQFWFHNLHPENAGQEIPQEMKEGRKVLKQLLQDKEGYSEEFRKWLRQAQIIPHDLFPTTHTSD